MKDKDHIFLAEAYDQVSTCTCEYAKGGCDCDDCEECRNNKSKVTEQAKAFNSFTAAKLIEQLTETLPEENKFEYLVRTLTDRKYFNAIKEPLEQILNAELESMQDVLR